MPRPTRGTLKSVTFKPKRKRFGKGDVLMVYLRIVQERSGLKISVERSVNKVVEHRFGQEQATLF